MLCTRHPSARVEFEQTPTSLSDPTPILFDPHFVNEMARCLPRDTQSISMVVWKAHTRRGLLVRPPQHCYKVHNAMPHRRDPLFYPRHPMFEIDGLRYDSLSALCKANTASIDQSVHADISMSPVWTSAHSLPQDAASRYWQQPRKYARISEEQNNAAFAKQLQLRGGRICWDGSLSLRLTKEVNPKEEVLAARGLQFWESHS